MFFYNYDGERLRFTFFKKFGVKCTDIYQFADTALEKKPCHIAYADIDVKLLEMELSDINFSCIGVSIYEKKWSWR